MYSPFSYVTWAGRGEHRSHGSKAIILLSLSVTCGIVCVWSLGTSTPEGKGSGRGPEAATAIPKVALSLWVSRELEKHPLARTQMESKLCIGWYWQGVKEGKWVCERQSPTLWKWLGAATLWLSSDWIFQVCLPCMTTVCAYLALLYA